MMTQKTISLNEKSYKMLKKLKKENESYSDLIIRLCSMQDPFLKDPLLEFSGIFSEDNELWEEIEQVIKSYRNLHLTNHIE
ncbi:MAG: antitoxin VapB family protein [Candidatus Lokiarchaeota archaeon]|nr:antitoxin VapB family protein [Candidatus Lokiarchaeota archaeon]